MSEDVSQQLGSIFAAVEDLQMNIFPCDRMNTSIVIVPLPLSSFSKKKSQVEESVLEIDHNIRDNTPSVFIFCRLCCLYSIANPLTGAVPHTLSRLLTPDC